MLQARSDSVAPLNVPAQPLPSARTAAGVVMSTLGGVALVGALSLAAQDINHGYSVFVAVLIAFASGALVRPSTRVENAAESAPVPPPPPKVDPDLRRERDELLKQNRSLRNSVQQLSEDGKALKAALEAARGTPYYQKLSRDLQEELKSVQETLAQTERRATYLQGELDQWLPKPSS